MRNRSNKSWAAKDRVELLKNFEDTKSRYNSTMGHKTAINHFSERVVSNSFQVMVKVLREKYKIPADGFLNFHNDSSRIPVFEYPSEWQHKDSKKVRGQIADYLRDQASEWDLYYEDWREVFLTYLFYNQLLIPDYGFDLNVCLLRDLSRDPIRDEEQDSHFPISIKISPYASKNEILDFVEKVYWPEIATLQDIHRNPKSLIGKVRSKKDSISKRNALVWKIAQKGSTYAQIQRELADQDILLDTGEIGKILSLERARRNK